LEKRQPLGDAEIVHLDDVGMHQLGADLGLAVEEIHEGALIGQVWQHDLHRHGLLETVKAVTRRPIDRRHSPLADALKQLVLTELDWIAQWSAIEKQMMDRCGARLAFP